MNAKEELLDNIKDLAEVKCASLYFGRDYCYEDENDYMVNLNA